MKVWYLLLSLLTINQLYGQSSGNVRGIVLDGNGAPLIGAVIATDTLQRATSSDVNGFYVFEAVPVGDVFLKVTFMGYTSATATVRVSNGQTTEQNFILLEDALQMDEVVVTGAVNERTKLASSVAITTLDAKAIETRGLRGTGELLQAIPGTFVESSTGEVGATIYARGLSSGLQAQPGFQYVSLQEEGLPVLSTQFNFSFVDMYFRPDITVSRLEAIRGGSSSIASANAPGGLFNFIMREAEGGFKGEARMTGGVQANGNPLFRVETTFGASLPKGWSYQAGGFYRYDPGARDLPYNANIGGQLRFNLIRKTKDSKLKIYGKLLRDQVTQWQYLPATSLSTRTALGDFNLNTSTLYPSVVSNLIPDGVEYKNDSTATRTFDSNKGIQAQDYSLGVEWLKQLGSGWTLRNNFKYSSVRGSYFQFAGNIVLPTETAILDLFGLPAFFFSQSFTYTDLNGQVVYNSDDSINLIGNQVYLAAGISAKNKVHDFIEQFSVSKTIGKHQVSIGAYATTALVKVNWAGDAIITSFEPNPQPLNITYPNILIDPDKPTLFITDQSSGLLSQGAQVYNNAEGSSSTLSLFVSDLWEPTPQWTIDAALRAEVVMHRGRTENFITAEDLNGYYSLFPLGVDGDYTTFYDAATKLGTNEYERFDFNYPYISGSVGVNYKLNEGMAFYVRGTKGNKAPELAYYFSNFVNGPIREGRTEGIYMGEAGFKLRTRKYALMLTGFYSRMNDVSFQLLVPGQGGEVIFTPSTFNRIRTIGSEIEAYAYPTKNFLVKLIMTLQDPRFVEFTYYNLNGTATDNFIDPLTGEQELDPETQQPNGSDDYTEDFSGNQLSEVPRLMIDLTPTLKINRFNLFLTWQYIGERQANRRNTLQLPGFSRFNAGVNVKVSRNMEAALMVNNIFNIAAFMSFDGLGNIGQTPDDITQEIIDQNAAADLPNPFFVRPALARVLTASISYGF